MPGIGGGGKGERRLKQKLLLGLNNCLTFHIETILDFKEQYKECLSTFHSFSPDVDLLPYLLYHSQSIYIVIFFLNHLRVNWGYDTPVPLNISVWISWAWGGHYPSKPQYIQQSQEIKTGTSLPTKPLSSFTIYPKNVL